MRLNERQFVGTKNKVPVLGNINDPDSWDTYDNIKREGLEPGWVIQPGYFVIDIDGRLEGDEVEYIFARTSGCYTEKSRSGNGWHIVGRTDPIDHKCKHTKLKLELYTQSRQVIITGTEATGDAETRVDLSEIVSAYFATTEMKPAPAAIPQSVRNFLMSRPDRWALFNGDASQFNGDISAAELSLCGHVAYATKGDREIIKAVMFEAFGRDKHNRTKYVEDTITKSIITNCRPASVPVNTSAVEFVPEDKALSVFADYATVASEAKLINKNCKYYGEKEFNMLFGLKTFEINGKKCTPYKAALCTIQHRADDVEFNPFKPFFSISDNQLLNTYKPSVVEKIPGDITPFLNHVRFLFESEHDQKIILNYLAACVQRPGVKYEWAPVLVGAQGTGKSMLLDMAGEAIGDEYYSKPNASNMQSNFNPWLKNKLFVHLEEANFSGNIAAVERMKSFITSSKVSLETKGVDETNISNYVNFALSTNNFSSVPPDRRYCFLVTNNIKPLNADEIQTVKTFAHGWLKTHKPVVFHYLHTVEIDPEYDPAKQSYAPTASKKIDGTEYTTTQRFLIEARENAETLEDVRINYRMLTGKYKDKVWIKNGLDKLGLGF